MHWFRNRRVRGRPAHPDVLTPASRSALARFALGAPFGWLRGGLGASWVGKAALVAGVAAISVGGYVAVAGLSGAGGDGVVPPLATAPAVPTETPVSTPDLREQIAGGAIRYLSESMDEPPEEIEVERIGEARWSNACLGVEIPDRECVGRPIDGFQITLTIRGR